MRALFTVSAVLVVAFGACSQSLTHDMSGSGGRGGVIGSGGEGANTTGSGGSTGGTGAQSACGALASEYQNALRAAQSCTIGGAGQCDTLVSVGLSVCGSCQTYVNDASSLNAIQQAWEAANCRNVSPAPPCALSVCPAPVNNVCLESPDDVTGKTGVCSYVSGTGGSSGAGGSPPDGGSPAPDGGLSNCSALSQKYGIALAEAKSCTAGAANQCAQQVSVSLGGCSVGCTDYVNDATELNQIRQEWSQAGCGNVAVVCPLIACLPPTTSDCVAADGGSAGVCSAVYNTGPVGAE